MTGRDDAVYLRHILEAIEQIEEYVTDFDDAQVPRDPWTAL